MYKIWLNADETGFITDSVGGHEKYIVPPPEGEYEYYFYVDDFTFKNIELFNIVEGSLLKKEG